MSIMSPNPFAKSLNVLLADVHPIFVEGLQTVLSSAHGKFRYHINGVARTGKQVTDLLREMPTDLLLMELNLPDAEGIEILPTLKKSFGNTRVVVMTVQDDPRLVKAAFRAGADGYLLKSGATEELFQAIEQVVAGHTFTGSGVLLLEQNQSAKNNNHPDKTFAHRHGLTRREIEIMRYIGQALNNKDIASRLFISDQTVSVHRKNIMRKLRVNNTATLIKIAFENNLV
ncbi:MAG: response regulator transcription factor [Saprospiraceae bacterium]|nr:response regulator transcription factor [Saprospiraceae bacterium]